MRALAVTIALLGAGLVQGCAPVVVGGAAAGAVIVAEDERSAGTLIDDQAIELKIANHIGDDEELSEQAHINVTSVNGVVLLSGEAPTTDMRNRAEQIASRTPKVKRVISELTVGPVSSFASRSKDTWITTKVKSQLLGDKEVAANQIKVITEAQTVYLLGLTSRLSAERATTIARQTKGVARVVKLFEYTH